MAIKGKSAYNNGTKVIYLAKDEVVPDGFVKGGLATRTHEQYVADGKKSGDTQKNSWKNKSEEEKQNWSDYLRSCGTYSQESIKVRVEHTRITNDNKPQDEKDAINKKRSISSKASWDKKSKEEKSEISSRIIANGGGWNHNTIKHTVKSKYNVDNISQLSEIKEKSKLSMIQTCQERYGVNWNCMLEQCSTSMGAKCKESKPNNTFADLLTSLGLEFRQEFTLGKYRYDFKVGNTLFEINPSSTHNSTWGIFNDGGLDKQYHYNKTKSAYDLGYHCINVWDWDDIEKVVNLVVDKEKIYARKCSIKLVDRVSAVHFINKYHIQNYINDKIRIGLYYNDELVSIMTFGKPRYNKKYEYELLRYCSSKNIVGGAEKLFSYFVKTYKPKSIISYCDFSKFTGNVYRKLGFTYITSTIGKHWYNIKTEKHITDNLLRKLGYDKLFNENYGKGTSNEQLMLEHKFVEIYDSGQQTYVWNNSDG